MNPDPDEKSPSEPADCAKRPSSEGNDGPKSRWKEIAYWLLLTLVTISAWCAYHGRWPGTAAFENPFAYSGDNYLTLTIASALTESPPPWDIQVQRLNAPFGASWNDYPLPEKLAIYLLGTFARWFGAGSGYNLFMLSVHVSAVVAFAWAARRLGAGGFAAGATALIFSFSHYMLSRSSGGHTGLTLVWHLPIAIWLLQSAETLPTPVPSRYWLGGGLLLAATSVQNPYYAILLFQLLGFCLLRQILLRRKDAAIYFAAILLWGCLWFVADQANVILYARTHGPNEAAAYRDLPSLVTWGLRLPDMFLPQSHFISSWVAFANLHYFQAGALVNENQMAFLGIAGVACFIGLALEAFRQGLQSQWAKIPFEAWISGYILLFALVGGVNYLLGSLGFVWLRGGNRFSIVLLCLALLWAARSVSRLGSRALSLGLVAGLLAMNTWEIVWPRTPAFFQKREAEDARANSDRQFSVQLESMLPASGAIFHLPVMAFPEVAPIHEMSDYEPFRAYFWTHSLRFSSGAQKGRQREEWQSEVESLSPEAQVSYLSLHGFDAILINRRGYADRAATLEAGLAKTQAVRLLESPLKDLVVYKIPRRGTALPSVPPRVDLAGGWWGWETDGKSRWAWSQGSAIFFLRGGTPGENEMRLDAVLESIRGQEVQIEIDGKIAQTIKLQGRPESFSIRWIPAEKPTAVRITTQIPPVSPANGDPRLLSFRLMDPSIHVSSPTK